MTGDLQNTQISLSSYTESRNRHPSKTAEQLAPAFYSVIIMEKPRNGGRKNAKFRFSGGRKDKNKDCKLQREPRASADHGTPS